MLRLVQLIHRERGRRVAQVEGDTLRLTRDHATIYACAQEALASRTRLANVAMENLSDETIDYDPVYEGRSEWRLLPSFDHPDEPARCLVSGTGLTHRKSAENRHAMHKGGENGPVVTTDSMRIYQWGVEGGCPNPGEIGAQPEWFYKGNGAILRGHGEPLNVPDFAEDGGEEPEIAGAYLIDAEGKPRRVGFTVGNEFSDHVMESHNYLYLAPSKLRNCSIGPELLVDAPFDDLHGEVRIERNGATLWSQSIRSGAAHMVHSLENLEHHHFKYEAHRRPGDAHVHFFGTGGFSFGSGLRLVEGDRMIVRFEGFGRSLRNPIHVESHEPALLPVEAL